MADKFSDLEKKIRDLNDKINKLGGKSLPDIDKILSSIKGNVREAEALFEQMSAQAEFLENAFENISTSLRNTLQDLKKQSDLIQQVNKSYNKLESIARQINDHSKNEQVLSVQKLKNLQKQTEEEINILKAKRDTLKAEDKHNKLVGKRKQYYDEINSALEDEQSYLNELNGLVENEVKLEKKRQVNLGITGGIFKGIHKTMKDIGIESEAFDRINSSMREAATNGNTFSVFSAGLKSTAHELKESFTDISVSVAIITKTFTTLKDIAFNFDDNAFQIQQSLGTSWREAQRLNEELFSASKSTAGLYSTHSDLVKAQIGLNNSMGTFNAYGVKALDNFTKLQEVAGMTTDEAAKLQEYGDLYGKSSEEIYDTIGKTKKGLFNNKQVMSQVLKINGQLAAQYKNSPELLAKAVVQANKLGMTLEQTKNAASGLLDFESSIQNELEAELLTGKNLNFEQARYLALMGDSAGAAEEMLKQVGGIDSFNKMNVIQQESIAKSMGMNTDELANSLVKQKQLEKLNKNVKKDLEERIKQLKDAGKLEEAAALEKAVLNGENVKSVKLAEQELDAKRESEKAIERAKEQFMKSIAPIATKVANLLTDVMDYVSKSPIIKSVIKAVGAGLAIGAVVASLVSVGNIISKVFGGGGGLGSLFGKRGSSPMNPMYVKDVSGGGGITDILDGGKGRKGGFGGGFKSFGSYFKDMFKGGRAGTVARARMMQGVKDIFTGGTGTFVGGANKAATAASKGTGILGKVGKLAKVLGPAGALLDLGLGTYSGAQAGSMTKEQQKAAGIRQGMGSIEGGIAGFLTGGAEKGSVMSEYLGIEKGGGADEAMGVLGAAGRGALIGSLFGPIGAAIGAGVGGIAESVKLLANPDSELRKTIAGWGDSISEFASSSWKTLKGWGSSLGETFSNIFSGIGNMASTTWSGLKSIGGGVLDSISSGLSSAGNFISSGVNTAKSWVGLAEGGIIQTPTKAKIGEGGGPEAVVPLDQFYAKLDQLITAVNNVSSGGGGDVILDGQKVGKVINMSARGIQ